ERHRIAEMLDRRDAVLPFPAHRTAQQVSRARLQCECGTLPARPLLAPQSEPARCAKRNPDHVIEYRPVAMPADAGAGAIFGDEREFQRRRIDSGEEGGPVAQRQQEVREIRYPPHLARGEIVMPAERDDAPITGIAVELERFE